MGSGCWAALSWSENGAFHLWSAETERSSGHHPLWSRSITCSSWAASPRQSLQQRPRTLIFGGGKAWQMDKRGSGGIRLGFGGMITYPGRKQRQNWLGLMEETFNSNLGIWMCCGLIPRSEYLTKPPPASPLDSENLLLVLLTHLTRSKQTVSVLLLCVWTHCACTMVR